MNTVSALLLATGLVLSGCVITEGSPGPSPNSTCSGSLSGTVFALVRDCYFRWSLAGGQALIANDGHITTDDEDGTNSFSSFGFAFESSGDARATTLDATSATVTSASLILSNPNGAGLIAYRSKKPGDTGAMVGTTTMKISSVAPVPNLTGVWDIHGRVTATLVPPPAVSYTGMVMVDITF